MNILYIHAFLTSLVFTCLVETAVVFALLIYFYRERHVDVGRVLFAGLFASFATIPYVWFVFPFATSLPGIIVLILAEAFAFLVEALFYKYMLRISIQRALVLSLVANAASYFLGPILRSAGLWLYW